MILKKMIIYFWIILKMSEYNSFISCRSIIAVPVRIASVSFNLVFSLTTGIIKKLFKIIRNKKKKHNNLLKTVFTT